MDAERHYIRISERFTREGKMKKRRTDIRPLLAISRELPSSIEVLEASLDALAKMHARETGLPITQAYADLLQNDETAREFYADLRAARRDPSLLAEQRERVRKSLSADRGEERWGSEAERELDALAEEHAKRKSITKAMAYQQVLQTDEGRELYARHRAKRQSAA